VLRREPLVEFVALVELVDIRQCERTPSGVAVLVSRPMHSAAECADMHLHFLTPHASEVILAVNVQKQDKLLGRHSRSQRELHAVMAMKAK